MRAIDKGHLLKELVLNEVDEKHVDSLIAWIKDQPAYKELVDNIARSKKSNSIYAACLYDEYFKLAIEDIDSLEDAFIAYAKIIYLAKVSRNSHYINPLIFEEGVDENMKVGDIVIYYDNFLISLDELINSKDYSASQKYKAVEDKINEWVDDLSDRLYKTIDELEENHRNLLDLRIMNGWRITELILIILLDMVAMFYLITNKQVVLDIMNAQDGTLGLTRILFYIFAGLLGILNVIFIVELITYASKNRKYIYARKYIFSNKRILSSEIMKVATNLKKYLINALEKKLPLDKDVKEFSLDPRVVKYIHFLYVENYRGDRRKNNYFSVLNIIVLSLSIILMSTVVIITLLHLGGVL